MTTLLLSLTAAAQRYPVTVTPTLLPPYTLNLSELTAPASARLMATITVNDLTASNLPVRLHFKLESTGITIESIKTAAVAPIFLGGGETLVLTGSDMAQYLRLDNLDFRGYSKEQYKWAVGHESAIWHKLVEKNMVYDKSDDVARRMIEETPFTRDFGNDSPGRLGVFIGFQIVQSYMKTHPETTLDQLMKMTDSQKLLKESGYKPN